jgi:hypothetical protein
MSYYTKSGTLKQGAAYLAAAQGSSAPAQPASSGSSAQPASSGSSAPAVTAPKVGDTKKDESGRTLTYVQSNVSPGTYYWSTNPSLASAPKTVTQMYNEARVSSPNLTYDQFLAQGGAAQPGAPAREELLRVQGNTTPIATAQEIAVRNMASSARQVGGDEAANAVYKAAGYSGTPTSLTAPKTFNVEEAQRVLAEYMVSPQQKTGSVYDGTEIIPELPGAKDKRKDEEEAEPYSYQKMLEELMKGEQPSDMMNPFKEGTEAHRLLQEMYGILDPSRAYSAKRIEELNKQKQEGTDFISQEAQMKRNILARQLADAERKREAGTQKIRGRQKSEEMALEEGRKRALRYLKGALAQKGAYGTTGTGMFNLAALTGQYDIKNAELRQQANDRVTDLEDKYFDIMGQIQTNELLTENEKGRLILELNRTIANSVDSVLQNLSNQEVALSGKAFDLGYQEKMAAAERLRQEKKELRDYLLKYQESGEYVDPAAIAYVTDGNPNLIALFKQGGETGRDNISRAVTNVYENMLGADWTTKINPATGSTYKEEATNEVVRLVSMGWKLEDALNRVRSAIANDAFFRKLQAAKFTVSGGGGSGGPKPAGIKYFKSGDDRAVEWVDGNSGYVYHVLSDGVPRLGKLPLGGESSSGLVSTTYNWIPETNPDMIEKFEDMLRRF